MHTAKAAFLIGVSLAGRLKWRYNRKNGLGFSHGYQKEQFTFWRAG
ncbi:MAG TPA: hypothetical protein PK777_11435 [Thermoguttaceae bacterium]|nr:hypothetical protein [Thermoguttaceae bacterium]HPP53556.1 hypothetical protein [Thermoguttaceae bacterium]